MVFFFILQGSSPYTRFPFPTPGFYLLFAEIDCIFRCGGLMTASTLKNNRDFARVYRFGKSYVSSGLVTYVLKNKKNNLRVGITTSKKIGKAVQRNRCRRIIRAAFCAIDSEYRTGYDIVFVARTRTSFLKSTDIKTYMTKHLLDAGVLK